MPYYAVFYQQRCVAKIVWDGETPYNPPFLYDELVLDEGNKIPVANGDEPTYPQAEESP
jgi:hypothetical protein